MSNPLQQYFRTPKLYVKLPTLGNYNSSDDIEMSDNYEVGVFPLTAIDQLMLRTPDALLNGQSLYTIIQSCVPSIKNVKKLTQPDINSIIVGIKVASNGAMFDFKCNCPSCQVENEVQINLTHYLDTADTLPDKKTIELDNDLLIYVKPYNFEQRNIQMINEFEESKALKLMDEKLDVDDTSKMIEISEHVNNIAQRTFDVVAQSLVKIEIKGQKEPVTDRTYLTEFLKGISKSQADIIINAIKELNETGIARTTDVVCQSCSYEWKQPIDFDPTSFFD